MAIRFSLDFTGPDMEIGSGGLALGSFRFFYCTGGFIMYSSLHV